MRTKLVNGVMLLTLASACGISQSVKMSPELEALGGKERKNIMEDAFESFIAALFLDQGCETISRWVVNILEEHVDFTSLLLDATWSRKDRLIKHMQTTHKFTPRFLELQASGPDKFQMCVKDASNCIIGIGSGASRKQAENQAASNALQYLGL